ncbi:MAG TPA: Zn-dependent hydrolase [Alphaproteobacteria bacterium]|nr:Zn-dependent hydrolase [Alphaproteobacteria bacterium]
MTTAPNHPARAAAERVDERRLWDRHMAMAQHGARPDGGVNRQAFSAEDAAARRLLADWAAELGLEVHIDPVTNLFLRLPGTDPEAAPVVTGSHLDSQPMGGKFDGAFGVLAGLEAVEAISKAGVRTRRPIEIVAWVNEEGSRFQPGMTGSAAFTGVESPERATSWQDGEGVTIADTLPAMRAATPEAKTRPLGFPIAAYVEAHIEQGPRLEAAGLPVGIVTGIQGIRWFTVEIEGEAAHAGTTPKAARRDALAAAVRMVAALERLMADPDDVVRFTVGRFEVRPGSPNTVPDRALFTIDFRHPDATVLARLGDSVAQVCREEAGPCGVTVTETQHTRPVRFPDAMTAVLRDAAEALGIGHMDLPSGAGHDAKHVAGVCPSAMLFVPCRKGISHNPAEHAEPADLAAGTRALAHALVELANR